MLKGGDGGEVEAVEVMQQLVQASHPAAVEAEAQAGVHQAVVVDVLARLDRTLRQQIGEASVELRQPLPRHRRVDQQFDALIPQQGAVKHAVEAADVTHRIGGAGGLEHQIHVFR
ncbi:MAG: hypothetical protein ACKO6F_06730 [Cyanobium sp.]